MRSFQHSCAPSPTPKQPQSSSVGADAFAGVCEQKDSHAWNAPHADATYMHCTAGGIRLGPRTRVYASELAPFRTPLCLTTQHLDLASCTYLPSPNIFTVSSLRAPLRAASGQAEPLSRSSTLATTPLSSSPTRSQALFCQTRCLVSAFVGADPNSRLPLRVV